MSQIYVITGASRGLGLELVEQIYNQEDSVVYAGARNPGGSKGLMALVDNKKVFSFVIDVNSEESIKNAVKNISENATDGIDVLINNAAIANSRSNTVFNTPKIDYLSLFETNVCGVSNVTQAFLPLLRQRSTKKIINVSTSLASIGEAQGLIGRSAYIVSKAALNMLTKMFANALESESFIVVSIHPGWVKTDMGGQDADLDATESVSDMLPIIANFSTSDNG